MIVLQPHETSEFLREVEDLACEESSERKTKLIYLLVECGIVELIQKMHRRYLCPQLLEKGLPDWIDASIHVMFYARFLHYYTYALTFDFSSPKKVAQPTQFSAHVRCGQTAG